MLLDLFLRTGVAFEWLATGRGVTVDSEVESPAIAAESFGRDLFEERLLLAFRKIAQKKRERFVVWIEDCVSQRIGAPITRARRLDSR